MSKTTAAPGGFDLGTSPHGLSAGLPEPHQETPEARSSRPIAAAFPDLLPGGSAVAVEAGTVSGQSGQPAPQGKAAGIHPPASLQAPQGRAEGLTFSLTEAQRSALSFAALCEAEELQCGYEAHLPEVQEAIRHLWQARRILEGAPA